MANPQQFSVVGKRVQRVEGFDKVTGDSEYIADIYLPGMLVGKVLRSQSTLDQKLAPLILKRLPVLMT